MAAATHIRAGNVARVAAGAALAVAVLVVIVIAFSGGGGGGHTLRATFDSVLQVVPGNDVRLAGRRVGAVTSVGLAGGKAVLGLRIDDDRAWPLRRGTVARLDFGLPATYASRYVELVPGPASQPPLGEGGILTTADTITPVEFDQLYRIFGPRTRRNFQGLLTNTRTTLDGHAPDLERTLTQGSHGPQALADAFDDLGGDRAAMQLLVAAGARTTGALRRREAGLQGLVSNAAATFDELAGHARALQATLDGLAPALDAGRHTLGRLDVSVGGLQGLVADVRPGAAGLRRIAPTVQRAVTTLLDVAPLATSTLRTGRRQAPTIRHFLAEASAFSAPLSSVLGQLAPMAACLRPYGPEVVGFMSTWTSAMSNFDVTGRYARAAIQGSPISPGTTSTSKQITDALGGRLTYAMPRPPGLNEGQPWFIPQCGITPAALDPSKDPEAR